MSKDRRNDVYFAADEAESAVETIMRKSDHWFGSLIEHRYIDKVKRSWNSYHGSYYENEHDIGFGGEQGELVELAVNHFRNIAQHQLTMITSNRPSFTARAMNTDSKSQMQTTLANGLLEYYMRDKRLEKYLKKATEHAIVLGTGYIKMEWNSTSGNIVDTIERNPVFAEGVDIELLDEVEMEDGSIVYIDSLGNTIEPLMNADGELIDENGEVLVPFPVYEGDVEFKNLSVLDVVFDTSKENPEENDWVVCRTYKNRFDIAAKYPELKNEILSVDTKSDQYRNRMYLSPLDETDDIPVYEFFHRKTESMPEGRYMLYLDSDIILMDTNMPYRELPIYRIAPSDILGTPFGYTSMFDLLPIQDAVNSLYSTVLTNQNAHGVPNILNPMGNNVSPQQLEGGMGFIEYNSQVGKPEVLNLTATAPEIFNFMGMLEKQMEMISGINAVSRGNPEQLKSGVALAMIQSQALQFMNGLQQSYIQLMEDIGTGLIKMLQDFADVPRVAEIAGMSNVSKLKSFKNTDIDAISRMAVDVGNPLSATTAGRVQMADNLIQMGLIETPEQYFAVINTGRLDVMTQSTNDQLILVKSENEALMSGDKPVKAVATDSHAMHIREHRAILNDTERRLNDPEFVARTLAHIQEHIDALRNVDPDLLAILNQQPLGPVGGSPVNPQNAQPPQPNQGSIQEGMLPPQEAPNSAGLPNPPKPPQV